MIAAASAGGAAAVATQPPPGPQAARAAKPPKPPKPWPPDAATLDKRRLEAEALTLFASHQLIDVTITADFKAVQRDRDVKSTTTYPGTISITTGGAAGPAFPIRLRTRGNVRRNPRLCEFAPLLLELPKDRVKGTVFEGQGGIKLGVHCQADAIYQQYLLKEYLANLLLNALTPRSLRVRLANVTYADSTGSRKPFTKIGIFYEAADDMAKRMDARELAVRNQTFKYLDQPSLRTMAIFQYMIGNTDCSIMALHNIILLDDARGVRYPVPYDFDYSGLVNAHYAVPAPSLGLSSVTERRYRGPCMSEAEVEEALKPFREKQGELLALPGSMPGLDDWHRKNAGKYLNEFFELLGRPDRVKRVFVTDCKPVAGI